MPAAVSFVGGESFVLAEDFENVNRQLGQHDYGLFNRKLGDLNVRVTIYKTRIAYIQEHEPQEPFIG
jgi:hypothetical protein